MGERFKLRHVHAITGAFVLIALGALMATLVLASRSQRWFIGNIALRIVLPEEGAAGVRRGSEVYVLGTLVGNVSDVSVDPGGRMTALANIRRDFFRFLRADASAVVKRKFGVVGDAYFEIERGQGGQLPEKEAIIVCKAPVPSALETAVEEVRREAVPTLQRLRSGLETWSQLGSNLIASDARLDAIFVRADRIATELQQGKGSVGKLLTDPSVADDLKAFLAKANRAIEELPSTLSHLKTTSGNLEAASTNLPSLASSMSKAAQEFPALVSQTQTSLRELERLIEAMQRHWLLRRYVNKTNPAPSRPLPATEARHKNPPNKIRSPKDLDR